MVLFIGSVSLLIMGIARCLIP